MQQGRGGMGSHKHGISGYSGPSPRFKMWRVLYDGYEKCLKQKRPRLKYSTVREALEKDRTK